MILRRFARATFRPPKTLKAQLLFYGAASVLIAGALVGWFDFQTADAEARRELQEHMREVSTALVSALERVELVQGQQILDAFQQGYGAGQNSEALLVDPQGQVIAATRRASIGKPVEEAVGHAEPGVWQVLAGQQAQAQMEMTHAGVPVLDFTLPLHSDPTDPARVTGALHYAEPYTAYADLLQRTLLRFLLSELLLVVLLIVPFWLFLDRRILRPVQSIVKANRALAQGRREESTIPEAAIPDDEIGEIARSRAEMLARLETVRAQERLAKLNECLLSFGADPDENISRLVAFCGEQLHATCALYNRLEGDRLRALGQWHTPPDFNLVDEPEGHICYDVIQSRQDKAQVIRDLPHTGYAQTDPNVVRYALKTYLGKAVVVDGVSVGSLCVVYQTDTRPSEDDLNLLGIAASAVGVEEKRKRAEEELWQLKQFNEDIVQKMAEGIVVEDTQGCFTFVNPAAAQMLGYTPDEMIGRHWMTIVPPDQQPVVQAADTRRARGQADRYEIELLRKDGTRCPVIVSGSPRWQGGQFVGTMAVFTDITARREAEEEREQLLQETETMRGRAVALLEITQVAGSSLELKLVLKHIAQRTAQACQANRCTIFLLDETAEYLQPVMSQFADGHADLEQWQHFKALSADPLASMPLFHTAIRERRQALLDEAARTDLLSLKWTQPFGIQKLLAIPLVSRDQVIGLMALDHTDAQREFTPEQIDLALTIGGQVAANIENARLYTKIYQELVERKRAEETLRRREAILEAISFAAERFLKTTAWQADIQAVLERLGQATGVSRVYIFENHTAPDDVLTSQRYEWAMPGITPQIDNAELQNFPLRAAGFTRWVETLSRGELIYGHVREFPASERAVLAAQDIHSIVVVPIFVGETWWGFIGFDECRAEREWSVIERDALKTAADTLGAALERQHVETELQTSARQQAALFNLSAALAGALDETKVCQTVARGLHETMGYAHVGLFLVDPATGERVLPEGASVGWSDAPVNWRIPPGQGVSEYALLSGQLHYTPDVTCEPRYISGIGAGAEVDVPICVGDQVVGVLVIESQRPHAFEQPDFAVLTAAANQTSLALQRAREHQAVKVAEARYHTLFNTVPVGIYQTTLDGQYLMANPTLAHIFGNASPEELMATVTDLNRQFYVQPDRRAEFIRQIETQDAVQAFESEVYRKDGRVIWISENARALRDAGGNLIGFEGMMLDITERKQAEEALRQANAKLTLSVKELEQRNNEIALLNEMGDLLQTCRTIEEAGTVVAQFSQRLFPHHSGALGIIAPSRNFVEATAIWGPTPPSERVFIPEDCWALRRGQVHQVSDLRSGLVCRHIGQPLPASYLCAPMMAQGETLGILHLRNDQRGLDQTEQETERVTAAQQRLVVTVAEHIALALANLKLRETLRQQAIRDPLTGLFNRRYMEETLERELRRAERRQASLGIVLFDLDHFKRFNDTFGHPAGDAVLREIGAFIQTRIRAEDIACRYGGEEFVIILPEASLEDTLKRAERIREGIKQLHVRYRDQALGAVTTSLGIAVFPKHGSSVETILKAADAALYRAKREGRDRVVIAPSDGHPR